MSFDAVTVTAVGKDASQYEPTTYLFTCKDFAASFKNDLEAKFESMGCDDLFHVTLAHAEVVY